MPKTKEDFSPFTLDDILEEEYDQEHQGRYRKIDLQDNTVHIRREDPFGFWYVSIAKGQVPDKLKGAYTSFDQALKEVNVWLKNKKEAYIPSEQKKVK